MTKVRHLLGISGGKDSAALAIYMKKNYPDLDIEYYTADTGKELDDTYELIDKLEVFLGRKITRIAGADKSSELPFDHFLKLYKGYLPSSNARWCTKKLKIEPFEKFVGNDKVISYVGIRGDEDREGYISRKSNIQSIFPFRKNIWSEEVVAKFLKNGNMDNVLSLYHEIEVGDKKERLFEILKTPLSRSFNQNQKLNQLLNIDTKAFNKAIFTFIKQNDYPLAEENAFPLVENDEILVRKDIFSLLEDTGVGVPAYYKEVEFEVNDKKSTYARSRSGCFFCFYQQKIEWVWLYEQHTELFKKAMEYEKDGYTWIQDESLGELIKPERIEQIKEDYIKRTQNKNNKKKSPFLLDILGDAEGVGCASCFI